MRIEYNSDGRRREGSALEDCYSLTLQRIAAGQDTTEMRALLNDAARHIGKPSSAVQADIHTAKRSNRPNLARALAKQAGVA